ncbi:MAG: HAD family hydrolase [Algoriphagus sp.]|uniref:HAD family hydrolase n=1 Tax=Algoriphagus sp. TaxID=1872435 RepID=UPI00260F5179|nr:HAD family hydrolase [Algoriphagus sp.]MDG1276471.1 HAD family hydrolase [Algoriphagus sp.]
MKIDISPYKHFSFDLWLTLIRSNPLFKKQRDILFREYFSIEGSIEKVSEMIRYYDLLCNKISEKTGTHLENFQIYYLILNALDVNIAEINVNQLNEFYLASEQLFMKYRPELIFPEIDQMFKKIQSKGKTISILSNTAFINGSTLRKLISYYELSDFFSFQLYSDEMKISKPNIQVFKDAFENASQYHTLSKKEMVHIGDNRNADYYGALNFGLNAILI